MGARARTPVVFIHGLWMHPDSWSNWVALFRAVPQTAKQFYYVFGNALSEQESDELFARYAIPAPGRPLFEAAFANVFPNSPAKVNRTADRGPLLIIGGGKDHTVPEVVARAAYNLYRNAKTVNEYKVFPDRGHSVTVDRGWKEVADASLAWLRGKGL